MLPHCAFNMSINDKPHILWKNILDAEVSAPYAATRNKDVLVHYSLLMF
jgi:hypothetical protein